MRRRMRKGLCMEPKKANGRAVCLNVKGVFRSILPYLNDSATLFCIAFGESRENACFDPFCLMLFLAKSMSGLGLSLRVRM